MIDTMVKNIEAQANNSYILYLSEFEIQYALENFPDILNGHLNGERKSAGES